MTAVGVGSTTADCVTGGQGVEGRLAVRTTGGCPECRRRAKAWGTLEATCPEEK